MSADEVRVVVLDADETSVLMGGESIRVVATGTIGPRGAQGPPGPPGGGTYIHHQDVPASTWVIVHNLNRFPPLAIVDSAGATVIPGELVYDSANQVTATFGAAFAGRAYL